MRKLSCSLLLLSLLVLVAAQAQAQEDPYVGHYNCSGDVESTCGSCSEWVDPAPVFTIDISSQGGSTYQFCITGQGQTDCYLAPIQDGHVHWSQQESAYGITLNTVVDADIKDGQWNGTEKGSLSGACTCSFSVQATCNK
jgi:hypothetical protein